MKKILSFALTLLVCLSLAACGSGGSTGSSTATAEKESSMVDDSYIDDSELQALYTDPDKFKERRVKLTGKVFSTPEKDEDGVYFQMWADAENSDLNTIIAYADSSIEISDGDYVIIDGVVSGTFEGENAFGGIINAPTIQADTLEVSSYAEVMAPTIKEVIPATAAIDQSGYIISVDKVELAEKETRVYVTVTNNSSELFNVYTYSSKIVQNAAQFEQESNYEAGYDSVQSELLPGTASSGIMTFGAIDTNSPFQVYITGSSGDYNITLEPYTFECTP